MKPIPLLLLFSCSLLIIAPCAQSDSLELTRFFSTYDDHPPIAISNDNELAAIAIRGAGTENDPYILEGWNITSGASHPISIRDTTSYFVIQNCWLRSHPTSKSYTSGVYIRNVANGTATIKNSFFYKNHYGLRIRNSSYSAVINNTCYQNVGAGIRVRNSISTRIVNNTCAQSYLGAPSGGGYGISLESSNNSLITGNLLDGNQLYGIYLDSASTNNVLHHNVFLANNKERVEAYDDGIANVWYEPTALEGNYWHPYPADGIYLIDGNTGAIDPYPLSDLPFEISTGEYLEKSAISEHPQRNSIEIPLFLLFLPALALGLGAGVSSSEFLAIRRVYQKQFQQLQHWTQELEKKRLQLIEQSTMIELELIASEVEPIHLRNMNSCYQLQERLKTTWLPSVVHPNLQPLKELQASAIEHFRIFEETLDRCKQSLEPDSFFGKQN
ncbi:MAG: nitrous oxide reductase family maturation protein NosD [Candidatus Thorarchaeota archaeon]